MDIMKEFFPSHFIKAHDLNGQDFDLTIKNVKAESHGFPKRKSCCVYFHERIDPQAEEKCLGLNKTNATTLTNLFGSETKNWIGKRIAIFPTMTNFQGRQVPCIRIRDRAPAQAQPVPTQPEQQPQAPPAPDALPDSPPEPLPDNVRKRLHAVGTECYGKDWDERRPVLATAASNKFRGQAVTSSNDLTEQEALYLIQGMERKIAGRSAQQPPEQEQPPEQPPESWSAQQRADIIKRLDLAQSLDDIRAIEKEWSPDANRMESDDSVAVADAIGAAEERVKGAA